MVGGLKVGWGSNGYCVQNKWPSSRGVFGSKRIDQSVIKRGSCLSLCASQNSVTYFSQGKQSEPLY